MQAFLSYSLWECFFLYLSNGSAGLVPYFDGTLCLPGGSPSELILQINNNGSYLFVSGAAEAFSAVVLGEIPLMLHEEGN